jgi:replicative DNA helicase
MKDLFTEESEPMFIPRAQDKRKLAVPSDPIDRNFSIPKLVNLDLPYSAEAEQTILGLILLDNRFVWEAEASLTGEDFHFPSHRKIFGVMLDLARDNQDITPVTVANALGDEIAEIGGMVWLTGLLGDLPVVFNLASFVKILKEKATKRALIKLGETLKQEAGKDSTSQELINTVEVKLAQLREAAENKEGFKSFIDVAPVVHQQIEDIRNGINPAIPTGLQTLDKAIKGGGYPGQLHIWAALTGGAKSSKMKQIAQNIAGRGVPVGIVTAEMSDFEVFLRMLSPASGVPAWKFQPGISHEQLDVMEQALVKVANLPIWIDDRTTNIYEIRARVKDLKRQHNIQVLFVDYLQLLEVKEDTSYRYVMSRAQEMATCSRTLKKLAKELNIWIYALAQFNRKANEKDEMGISRPELHHLAESGKLEQDSDIVGIIDLDDYVSGQPLRRAQLRIVKHRNGPKFDSKPLEYLFNSDYMIFQERAVVSNLRPDQKTKEMF